MNPPQHVPRPRRRRRILAAGGVTAALALAAALAFATLIHPFLASSHPVPSRTLVVEGWIPDYALEVAAREFRSGKYERLVTTGGPVERGSFLTEYKSYAEIARATLLHLGVAPHEVVAVPAPEFQRNRTFGSAVAFREFAQAQRWSIEAINLVSVGTHSRRSQLCFQRALGPSVPVGILAVPTRDYLEDRWWASSAGVKSVLGEVVGFVYAWCALDDGS